MTAPVDVLAVPVSKIQKGGKFRLLGDKNTVYTRGEYARERGGYYCRDMRYSDLLLVASTHLVERAR